MIAMRLFYVVINLCVIYYMRWPIFRFSVRRRSKHTHNHKFTLRQAEIFDRNSHCSALTNDIEQPDNVYSK